MNITSKDTWNKLLPDTSDPLLRGGAGLVIVTCAGVILAILALILTWLISGDLQAETVLAGLVLGLILAGIAALARSGRVWLACWTLVVLLWSLVTVDAGSFGLASPAAAGYFIPVTLAACGLGLRAAIGVAGASSGAVWSIAVATSAGWYEPLGPVESSHLTFNAPFLTVLLLLVALLVGAWNRYLQAVLQSRAVQRD